MPTAEFSLITLQEGVYQLGWLLDGHFVPRWRPFSICYFSTFQPWFGARDVTMAYVSSLIGTIAELMTNLF